MKTLSSPTVRIDGIAKRFGDRVALERISATIMPGEFVAIIGRSGAGKTTLLRCLSRAVSASEGSITVGEQEVGPLQGPPLRAYRARVGMIYQQFNLVKRLRVIDNVLVGRLGHLRGWRSWAALGRRFSAADQAVALRCLQHVGLLAHAWQRTDTLSGGEQQRVAIAKVMAQEPALILADEPVASLDLLNGAMVMETLRDTASRRRLTVVATLHHVEYARQYADRVLGLRDGRCVFDGPAADLTDDAVVQILGELPRAISAPASGPLVAPAWAASVAS